MAPPTTPTPTGRARHRELGLKVSTHRGFDSEVVLFVLDPALGTLRQPRPDDSADFERIAYELRAPSIKARAAIMQAAVKTTDGKKGDEVQLDIAKLQLLSLIECTYVPAYDPIDGKPVAGGTERVFTAGDFEELSNAPVGTHIDVLAKKAQALVNLDPDTVGKG